MTLEVDPQRIRKQGSEWQVVVHPSEEPSKLLEYYEALADVEMALDEREHLNVWLVTGDPEHSRAADAEPQAVPAP